jgi:hypothetical protein
MRPYLGCYDNNNYNYSCNSRVAGIGAQWQVGLALLNVYRKIWYRGPARVRSIHLHPSLFMY